MMKFWTMTVILSASLVVGCGDRSPENTESSGENGAAPATLAPAPEQSGGITQVPADATPPPGSRERAATETAPSRTAPERTTAAEAPRAPAFREVTVPAGTALPLELITAVSSETATVEMPVRARLKQAVVVDGYTALPAGAVLMGQVTDVERPGRVQGRARLAFRFAEVELDGAREELRTNPIAFEGEATRGEDATKIGAGAGVGAVIGGIVGGASGAAKGAAIGGAAGTGVVLATKGREVELTAGTDIAATTASAFIVRAPAR
jgi:hypothetical protein